MEGAGATVAVGAAEISSAAGTDGQTPKQKSKPNSRKAALDFMSGERRAVSRKRKECYGSGSGTV
jgi:hypothetical protein